MRVTATVREYVQSAILAKVADKLEAAEEARADAIAARNDKVKKAEELCKKMCAETQAKFAKEVKKTLGLTLIPKTYSYNGEVVGDNLVVKALLDHGDFVETLTTRDDSKARNHPCAARDEYDKIIDEPFRIKNAANSAANRLLFELELGKVAKGELDGMLQGLEVKV